MLLNRIKLIFLLLCAVLIFGCQHTITRITHADKDLDQEYKNLIEALSTDDNAEVNVLLVKWSDYVAEIEHYSNAEYLEALSELKIQYAKAINKLGDCNQKHKSLMKNYSSAWLDELIAHFGEEFIRNNEKSILSNLQMMAASSNENCCNSEIKDLIYAEVVFFEGYRNYLNMFFDFYNSLDRDSQNKLNARKKAAYSFLYIINEASMTEIVVGMRSPAQKLAEQQSERINKELFDYFKNHPLFSCDLDFFKAMDDLFKITRKDKIIQ